MYRERASWEKYRERMLTEARDFEQMKYKCLEKRPLLIKRKSLKNGAAMICDNDNKRTKITNLEADIVTLKGEVEEAQANRERVEIAELKRRLFEAHEKRESLEIDLAAEKVKADTAEVPRKVAEEARHINTSALNVVQKNYAEAQSIVDTLVSESEWMRNHGVAAISVANSILNATELDQAVAALTDAACNIRQNGFLRLSKYGS
ncbi:hypothetical protein Hanom_Chr10g00910831 [Helianthus anomalus]